MSEILKKLTEIRATRPEAIAEALATRKRRALLGESGTLFLLAADHPARGVVKAGGNPRAMADRGDFLDRIVTALQRPGVDGLMASPDIVEDLALLGALDGKVVIGSMNRGGLAGAVFELDDRFTGYTAGAIALSNLDGGKKLLRIADNDRDTLPTITACAGAVDSLAARGLMAMIEPFASRRENGKVEIILRPDPTIRVIGISSALGSTSAYTWLKLPVVEDLERVMAASTLPALILGGEVSADPDAMRESWRRALALPTVKGLVVGRSLLYPPDDDVAGAVDAAVGLL